MNGPHRITGFTTLDYQELIELERRLYDFRLKIREKKIRKYLRTRKVWKGPK